MLHTFSTSLLKQRCDGIKNPLNVYLSSWVSTGDIAYQFFVLLMSHYHNPNTPPAQNVPHQSMLRLIPNSKIPLCFAFVTSTDGCPITHFWLYDHTRSVIMACCAVFSHFFVHISIMAPPFDFLGCTPHTPKKYSLNTQNVSTLLTNENRDRQLFSLIKAEQSVLYLSK